MTGSVLRASRLSAHRISREDFAEDLGIDVNTLKGYETGRRPMVNAPGRTLIHIRHRLLTLGADPALVALLDTAMDVDVFVAQAIHTGDLSLLASWVSTREWNDLLAWAVAGRTPPVLQRPDQVGLRDDPEPPRLAIGHRTAFFDALRNAAAAVRPSPEADGELLRRQAFFMAAWDASPAGGDWLADAQRSGVAALRRGNGWSPGWATARSLAVARACQGDPEPLQDFIARGISDQDACEAANLNYWSYWIGEQAPTATSDTFMVGDLGPWRGAALLNHLAEGLRTPPAYIDLSVHSIQALIARRPHLLGEHPAVAADLAATSGQLLDSPGLVEPTRRALDRIHFTAATLSRTYSRRTS